MTLEVFKTPSLGRRLATATLVAVMGLGLAGCGDDTSLTSNNSGGNTGNAQPKADLTGTVVDTNNAPIAGVSVSVATRTTTTNAAGQWRIDDVEVVNTEDNSSTPDVDGEGVGLNVVLTPPAGYMGGHAEITPEAQVVSSQNGQTDGQGQTNPQLLWLDGYLVDTGRIALPKLASTVRLLGVKETPSGAPLAGGKLTLDFDETNSGLNDENNAGVNFQPAGVSWSATLDANGSATFTNLPENSHLNLLIEDYDFTNCGEIDNGLPDLDPEVPGCSSAPVVQEDVPKATCSKALAKPAKKATNAGDICFISTNRETRPITYTDMEARLLEASGDQFHPFLVSVTGVFNDTPGFNGQDYTDGDNAGVGLLTEGIDQSFTFNFSENLAVASLANVKVFNVDTQTYLTVASLTDNSTANTKTKKVTVNLAAPVDAGTTLKVYFLLPQFRDLASNRLVDAPNTNLNDPVGYDAEKTDDICGATCPNFEYVVVTLCVFEEPSTNPGSTIAEQEKVDPRLNGTDNDAPVNQTRSVTFNDVRDQDQVQNVTAFHRFIQQTNATGEIYVEGLMNALGFAFGEVTDVDHNVARVEFDPIEGFSTYRITVALVGGGVYEVQTSDFVLNTYDSSATDSESGPGNFETGSVLRGPAVKNFFIYETANEGDIVVIQAIDDLGNPGQLSNEVVIVDNVEPTVALQSSYQDLHDYGTLNGDSIEESASGDNVSGCYVRNDGDLTPDSDGTNHAGVKTFGGVDDIGSGGENTNGGEGDTVGNVCIGISPELIIAQTGDTDDNISTAHNELVAGRNGDFDDAFPGNGPNVDSFLAEAYDDDAFADWTAAARTTSLGVAFTEPLSSIGTPSESGGVGALLGAFTIQNLTTPAPTVNNVARPFLNYLARVPVSDALALANDEHDETIGFVGATDLAGNAATAAAAPFLSIRDEWAPYVVSAFRDENGDLTITFNEPVVIENGDTLYFSDGVNPSIALVLDTSIPNFTLTGGTVLVIEQTYAASVSAAFANVGFQYDDEDEDGDDVDDARHALLDFRSISDVHGNAWTVYTRSFADGVQFGAAGVSSDDVPVFIVVDSLGSFGFRLLQSNIVDGATNFTFALIGSHPVDNWIDLATDPDAPYVFGTSTGCTVGAGVITCDNTFVSAYLNITLSAGTCTVGPTSTAVFNTLGSGTTVTFNVVCAAGTALGAGDIVFANGDNNAVSALDPLQPTVNIDGLTFEVP